MHRTLLLTTAIVSLILAACRSPAPSNGAQGSDRGGSRGTTTQEHTTTAEQEPSSVPPSVVSHGEARIGGPRLSLRPYRLSSRRAGPVRLFAEIRYHWVTRHFDEGRNADTFVPISFGIMLGR